MATYYNPYYYPNYQHMTEISYFTGEDVDGWLSQVESLFYRHQTTSEQKLAVGTLYLAGDALEWYRQWYWDMRRSWSSLTWDNFAAYLRCRFWSEILTRRSMILESMSKTCEGIIQLLTEMKNENSVYMSNLSKLMSQVIANVEELDRNSENITKKDIVADSAAHLLDGSIGLMKTFAGCKKDEMQVSSVKPPLHLVIHAKVPSKQTSIDYSSNLLLKTDGYYAILELKSPFNALDNTMSTCSPSACGIVNTSISSYIAISWNLFTSQCDFSWFEKAKLKAANLSSKENQKPPNMLQFDGRPPPLGLEAARGEMIVLILWNSATKKKQMFSTDTDIQLAVLVQAYECEKIGTRDIEMLGKFKLSKIPHAPERAPPITVCIRGLHVALFDVQSMQSLVLNGIVLPMSLSFDIWKVTNLQNLKFSWGRVWLDYKSQDMTVIRFEELFLAFNNLVKFCIKGVRQKAPEVLIFALPPSKPPDGFFPSKELFSNLPPNMKVIFVRPPAKPPPMFIDGHLRGNRYKRKFVVIVGHFHVKCDSPPISPLISSYNGPSCPGMWMYALENIFVAIVKGTFPGLLGIHTRHEWESNRHEYYKAINLIFGEGLLEQLCGRVVYCLLADISNDMKFGSIFLLQRVVMNQSFSLVSKQNEVKMRLKAALLLMGYVTKSPWCREISDSIDDSHFFEVIGMEDVHLEKEFKFLHVLLHPLCHHVQALLTIAKVKLARTCSSHMIIFQQNVMMINAICNHFRGWLIIWNLNINVSLFRHTLNIILQVSFVFLEVELLRNKIPRAFMISDISKALYNLFSQRLVAFKVIIYPVEVWALNSNDKGLFHKFVDDTEVKPEVEAIDCSIDSGREAATLVKGEGMVQGAMNYLLQDENGPSIAADVALLNMRCSSFGNLLIAKLVCSPVYVNRIARFSLPRPPEIADLEDKVNFKEGGMLCTRIIGNIRGAFVIHATSLV
ncbi:hypothetical protein QQ045_005896 [Rhodiola kirilowii]